MSVRDLLFEIGTEELPPHSLSNLSAALAEQIVKGLETAGIPYGTVRSYATPRRLAVLIEGCAEHQPDRAVERRGPPLRNAFDASGEPTQAALAFAKTCGVLATDLQRLNTDKGAWVVYRGSERGAATISLLAAIAANAVAALPIARRMRWGAGAVEFVRPVHWVVLLFGADVVPCEILGLTADRYTFGHRFHAPRRIALAAPKTYEGALRRAKVIANFLKRRERIRSGVAQAAALVGARALIDASLLDEVTALVEWPVPVAGRFEERFLALPREVVIATVQDHQRYFPVEDADGRLASWFITVANIASRDPTEVRGGNERVVRPRLSDAAFFWDQDRKIGLNTHAQKLAGMTFQAQLGSYADKTRRLRALALRIGAMIGSGAQVLRAAELAKADLMTAMVGEFPELQGTMGRYYAVAQGEAAEVSVALEEQYLPRFAGDVLPATNLGRALALADRIDTLTGIFAIGQRPTGAKDPFGLRRAALGVLRIVLDGGVDVDLLELLEDSAAAQPVQRPSVAAEVHAFIIERLRGLFLERDAAATAEMIDAVLAVQARSPLDAETRLRALAEFVRLPESAGLAAANKRIANILRKAQSEALGPVDVARFAAAAERVLHDALLAAAPRVAGSIRARHYAESLRMLSGLREPIDAFFETVMVMDENLVLRNNRLALLRDLQTLIGGVADLSRLTG